MGLLVPMMAYLRAYFLSRHRLALEAVALRQQLVVFTRKQPRPRLDYLERLFWIALHRWYSGWANALILVKPETGSPGTALASDCFALEISAIRPTQGDQTNS